MFILTGGKLCSKLVQQIFKGVLVLPVFKATDDRRKCAFKDADLIELRAKMACFRL